MTMANTPAVPAVVRRRGQQVPDRMYVEVQGLDRRDAYVLSQAAVQQAQLLAPKMSGRGARGIKTYYGDGFFGLRFDESYMWYQEHGIKARTMRSLAGKVIPMWIDDPSGKERRKNPKAKTRITANGRHQVLIFRRAAKIGATKTVRRPGPSGRITTRVVPASYPGAPGRISHRQHVNREDNTTRPTGRVATTVNRPHVGVRWRHPGLLPRHYMQFSLQSVARNAGLGAVNIQSAYRRRLR